MRTALTPQPHEVLKLNNLPPSVLSSQPHLLRTRKTLLISRHHVPPSHVPSATLFSLPPSVEDEPAPSQASSEEEERERVRRERERAVKRFQLLTKSIDPRVGDAYISLSELDEVDSNVIDDLAALEIDQWAEMQQGKGSQPDGAGEKKRQSKGKKAVPAPSNREERALEAFYEDEDWERETGGPSRSRNGGWKVVGDPAKLGIKV